MFHLRYTPDDISGYTFDFLESYDKYILAQEDIDDNGSPLLHYHILIITDYGVKTIRDSAKIHLKIPSAGRGKNNKYYALMEDWKDPGYICKYNNILKSKGYTDKEILDYVISGKNKYLDRVKKTELSGEEAPAVDSNKSTTKTPKVPFQQAVIASAAADWYNYKRETRDNEDAIEKTKIVDFVCKAMREHGKGINAFMVRELALAVLYDDLEYRDVVVSNVKKTFLL